MENRFLRIHSTLISPFFIVFCFLFICIHPAFSQKYKIKKVVIDAGHGGKDPGALGKLSKEKDLALSIALKIGKLIESNHPNIQVGYTRKTDVFIPLDDRAAIANKFGADLFISVHINAHTSPSLKGTATYSVGLNRAEENLDVTKRENSVILIEENYKTRYEGYHPDDPESHIIFSLMQNANQENSLLLAQKVQNQYTKFAGRKNRGVKQGGLIVLWKTSMPGILTEVGYISNPDEEKFMLSLKGQTLLAMSVYKAFVQYKKTIESRSEITSPSNGKKQTASSNENISPSNGKKQVASTSEHSTKTAKAVNKEKAKKTEPLHFSVQIKSSLTKLDPAAKSFKGLDIQELKQDKLFIYISGNKSSPEEIISLQKTIRAKFKDAFAIGIRNGKKIPYKEAVEEFQHQTQQ